MLKQKIVQVLKLRHTNGSCAKLEKKGIEDLAIVDLLDLTKKHPDIAETHYALGFCYEELGDKEAAGTHYSKYVGALKKGKFVEQAKAALKKLSQE